MDVKLLKNNNIKEIDNEYNKINSLYDECINYLERVTKVNYSSANFNLNHSDESTDDDTCNNEDVKLNINEGKNNNGDYEMIIENKAKEVIKETSKNNGTIHKDNVSIEDAEEPFYTTIKDVKNERKTMVNNNLAFDDDTSILQVENELDPSEDINTLVFQEIKSNRLRRISEQLPKIIITQSNTSLSKTPNLAKELRKKSISVSKIPPDEPKGHKNHNGRLVTLIIR